MGKMSDSVGKRQAPKLLAESVYQRKLKGILERQGAVVFNVKGDMMQASGWPDLQVYALEWKGQLELKVKTQLSPLQIKRIQDLRSVGVPAWVVRFVGGNDVQIEDIDKRVVSRTTTFLLLRVLTHFARPTTTDPARRPDT